MIAGSPARLMLISMATGFWLQDQIAMIQQLAGKVQVILEVQRALLIIRPLEWTRMEFTSVRMTLRQVFRASR